jgi:hypothetical protein
MFSQIKGQPIFGLRDQGVISPGLAAKETSIRNRASRPLAQLDNVMSATKPRFHGFLRCFETGFTEAGIRRTSFAMASLGHGSSTTLPFKDAK